MSDEDREQELSRLYDRLTELLVAERDPEAPPRMYGKEWRAGDVLMRLQVFVMKIETAA
jgi:hypothetical protein